LSGWFKIYKYEKSNYIIIIRLPTSASLQGKRRCQVGLNLQDGGTGILSSDFGIGENMSLGLTANYLLSVNEDALGNIPDFGQRVDLKHDLMLI
jgi:hypothetical protein